MTKKYLDEAINLMVRKQLKESGPSMTEMSKFIKNYILTKSSYFGLDDQQFVIEIINFLKKEYKV